MHVFCIQLVTLTEAPVRTVSEVGEKCPACRSYVSPGLAEGEGLGAFKEFHFEYVILDVQGFKRLILYRGCVSEAFASGRSVA